MHIDSLIQWQWGRGEGERFLQSIFGVGGSFFQRKNSERGVRNEISASLPRRLPPCSSEVPWIWDSRWLSNRRFPHPDLPPPPGACFAPHWIGQLRRGPGPKTAEDSPSPQGRAPGRGDRKCGPSNRPVSKSMFICVHPWFDHAV